jgi:hypothetical protein|tara:strand:+ start:675 stop:869 length:195 start_codon:yes stop_codon:yes gene_type:complete
MNKEIADMLNEILNDYYDSIQYMDREDRVEAEQYSKYFKCKKWLDTVRIGKFPNALPFKESESA